MRDIPKRLIEQVKRDEGFRQYPYADSVGVQTIGYGRNLQDVGIRESEAAELLINDLSAAWDDCQRLIPCFKDLDDARKAALVNMAFNLGISRLAGFRGMLAALAVDDWETAAREALDSRWAKQVGARALRLSEQIRTGIFQEAV
jgi:lysozyme